MNNLKENKNGEYNMAIVGHYCTTGVSNSKYQAGQINLIVHYLRATHKHLSKKKKNIFYKFSNIIIYEHNKYN